MKLPRAIAAEVERVGRLILAGELTFEEGIDALEPLLQKDEHRLYVLEVLRRHLRGQIKAWIKLQLGIAADEEDAGIQRLPFDDLPPHLEIAPGLFKHQRMMTPKDWNAAVVQAETKAENARGFAERVRRARDKAVEVLGAGRTFAEVEPEHEHEHDPA